MAKTYQTPGQKQEQEPENKPRKSVGVYEHPERAASTKLIWAVIAIIIAVIVIVFLVNRMARGEEPQVGQHHGIHAAVSTLGLLPEVHRIGL